jgi:hypothetical protein
MSSGSIVVSRSEFARCRGTPLTVGLQLLRDSAGRASRRKDGPPSDADIERGLRERAVSDPRAAEILLRWLQRPRGEERVGGVDLDSMSERQLERVYAGLLRLASLDGTVLAALVEQLAGDELVSSG